VPASGASSEPISVLDEPIEAARIEHFIQLVLV